MTLRLTPARLTLSYLALAVLALALLAVPLWYGFHANLGAFRSYVPAADMQRFVDLFHRDGPRAVAAAVDAYAATLPPDQVAIFAGPRKERLAGNLARWPAEVPDAPGIYGLAIERGGDASMRVVTSHVTLPDGYLLLLGRESVRFDSLVARFWTGVAGAMAIVLSLGLVFGWLLRRTHGQLEGLVEQRTAELRNSEERYERAMLAAEAGFWDWDVPADQFYVSPKLVEMAGLAPGSRFVSRSDWVARTPIHRDDAAKWERAVKALFASGETRLAMEVRTVLGGETRWVLLSGLCVRDAGGKILRWTGSATDVTARKRAQQELQLSEERYARAMEGSDAGHWDWNIVSDEIFVSERAREMLALPADVFPASRAEIMARVPMHPDDRAAMNDRVAAGIRSGVHERDYRVIARPGEVRWLRSRGKVYRDAHGAALRMTGSLTDITERKLAADAVRASEERHSLAMQAAQDAHWDWDMVSGEYYMSPRSAQLYGLPEVTRYASRADFLAVSPFLPEDRRTWEQATAELFAGTGTRLSMELRASVRGKIRWIQVNGLCVRDSAGKPIRWCGSSRDVTDRKRADTALRASEERFALAVAGSNDGLWDWDILTNEMFLSERAQRIYGLEPGRTVRPRAEWRELVKIHPDDVEGQLRNVEDYLAGKRASYEGEWRVLHPDGRYGWIRIRGICVRDAEGRPTRFAGSVSDIDERRRAEEALRRSESYLTEALRLGRAGSFAYDVKAHRNVHWSPTTYEIFDFDPAGGLPAPDEVYRRVHPEDAERVREARGKAMSEKADYDAHYRIVRRDGAIRHLHATGHPTLDANGEVAELVGVVTDVTERTHAEEEVKALERKLRQAQRLEAMGTLAGGIAHDFNNILGAILGYGEMALRDAEKGSRLRRDLDSIVAAGERGRALVDRVLAFSRSGVGERVPVHVEKVVREALDLLSAGLPPNVTLHAKLHAAGAAMQGDATQVHQVLMNLATNAIHAMGGGGTLRVSLRAERIERARVPTIGVIATGEYLVLEVSDTGSGIPAEILDRIFDPFFTTKEVGTGTGLGLSLVHGIVTEIGGAIDVASSVGVGTTFTVYLPRAGDVAEADSGEELALPRGDGQRVLVVDDEEPLVRLATRTLEELGYAAVGFTSSRAALAAFRADPQRFDALITDERMPGLSGSALIREVRGIRDRIPVVLMSGYVGAAVAREAREAGAEEVLKKPLSARDLAASLARVLHVG